ncbi:MAG TPA: hypothetical protein VMQ81_11135, partial [Acidimicrobiia bacterium]|nr:hypothetical protein [Acidimicrobiia bacterium]
MPVRERGAVAGAAVDRWWRRTRPVLAEWLRDVPPAMHRARTRAGRHPTVRALARFDAGSAVRALPKLRVPTLPPMPRLPRSRRHRPRWQRIMAVPLVAGVALGASAALLIPGTARLLASAETK